MLKSNMGVVNINKQIINQLQAVIIYNRTLSGII